MSNSSLVCYTKISPNSNNPRNMPITKITIHHMAGDCAIEDLGDMFARPSRQASSNYGIGSDGRIAMYVEEKNRSWCSSSRENDNQAITIEVADSKVNGAWKCTDKAMAALLDLCEDICRRNGIKQLNYTGDTRGNLTLHKWFANTDCPGAFLESKMPWIASEVNKRLNPTTATANKNTATATKKVNIELTQLSKGANGNEVKTLQRLLAALGYKMQNNGKTYGVDGSFGQATYNAVIAFQKKNGLEADGICGKDTWSALLK